MRSAPVRYQSCMASCQKISNAPSAVGLVQAVLAAESRQDLTHHRQEGALVDVDHIANIFLLVCRRVHGLGNVPRIDMGVEVVINVVHDATASTHFLSQHQ